MRVVAAAAVCACAAGCGGTTTATGWARPQRVAVSSKVDCGRPGHDLHIVVERLELRRRSWRVDASIVNRLDVPVVVYRAHHLGPATSFGLSVFATAGREEIAKRAGVLALRSRLVADRFDPPLPQVLARGSRWHGSFSGAGRLPRDRYVRVVFARFRVAGEAPPGTPQRFICVSGPARPR